MKIFYRVIGVAALSTALLLGGCVSPNGERDNTGTGAISGGMVGALTGALIGGSRHAAVGALIGGLSGVIAGGFVGHMIDQDQRAQLQQQSPQTLQTIQHNDYVAKQQASAPTPPSQAPSQLPPPATSQNLSYTPITVDDIKALTSAGVKGDAILKELQVSKSRFSPQDVAAVQDANPPVDPAVINYMKNNPS